MQLTSGQRNIKAPGINTYLLFDCFTWGSGPKAFYIGTYHGGPGFP